MKSRLFYRFITVVFFALISFGNYLSAQSTLSSGMVLYLPFDGSLADMSGLGHSPTNYGCTPDVGMGGLPNTAYRFTGSSYMVIPHHADLNPPKFSLCAKVKLLHYYNDFCYNNVIMSKGLDRTYGSYSLRTTETIRGDCAFQDSTKHNYRCDVQNISTTIANMNTTPYIVKGNWDCIVGTYDGDSVRMYVNGVLRYKYAEPGLGFNYDDVMLGRIPSAARPFFFNGVVDEIRMYNRALTPAEVSEYCGLTTPVIDTINAAFSQTLTGCMQYEFTDKTTTTSSSIVKWEWFFSDGSVSTAASTVHKFGAPGMYAVKLRVTDALGNLDSTTKTITVMSNAPVVAGPHDTTICGAVASVQLHVTGADHYKWTPATDLDNDTLPNPLATLTQTRTYVVSGTQNGCVGSDTVTITMKPVPVISVEPDTVQGCPGRRVQVTTTGNYHFRWFPPTGLSADLIPSPVISISGTIVYHVQAADEDGCVAYDSIMVTQFPSPNVIASTINGGGAVDCIKGEVSLIATGADTYYWEPAAYCDNPASQMPKVHPPSTTVFSVTGSNSYGCQAQDTVQVTYEGSSMVKVPSAFSPNNDMLNDEFRPIVICDFTATEFSIYSRWGNRLFETNDISHSWDGSSKGILCESGIYFYMLKGKNGKGEDVLFKGNVLLIR